MNIRVSVGRAIVGILLILSFIGTSALSQTLSQTMGTKIPPPDPAPQAWFDAERQAAEDALRVKQLQEGLAAPSGLSEAAEALAPAAPAMTGGTWMPQGPAVTEGGQVENISPNDEVIGAVHTVLAHPTDPDTLWLGSTNGGIWRTTNATSASPTWEPLTDDFPGLSIGALEMDPMDGTNNTLLAGIGRFSAFGGTGDTRNGLLRSTDGGTTWTAIDDALLVGQNISGVAARGGTLLASSNLTAGGIFRRASMGASWVQISGMVGSGLPAGTVFDLVGDPNASNRFYASVAGVGVFMSENTGQTWTDISDATVSAAFALAGNNNAEMAVAGNGRVYVGVIVNGQLQYIGFSDNPSTGGGTTWTAMDLPQIFDGGMNVGIQPRQKPGGQGGTHFSIRVDPNSSTTVYVGGDRQGLPIALNTTWPNPIGATDFTGNLWRGDTTVAPTGGVPSPQWEHLTHSNSVPAIPGGGTAGGSAPHADSREIVFDANDDMIEGDDGGIYRRTSPTNNMGDWFSLNGNLQITEFHDIAYDNVSTIIIGGAQDTGTHEQNVTNGTTYTNILVADGGDVAVDDTSVVGQSTRYYSTQFLGNFTRYDCDVFNSCGPATAIGLNEAGGSTLVTTFVTPVELNVTDQERVLIGGGNALYESFDQGNNIAQLTGPPGDPVGGPGGQNAIVYGHANNPDLIYVGSNNQLFKRTSPGGNVVATTGAFPGTIGTIRDVAVDSDDEDHLIVIDSNQVFRSVDGGDSWTEITGNIGDGGAASFRTAVYISAAKDMIAVGSDAGVLASQEPHFDRWFLLGESLPDVIVYDMDYDAKDDVLVAGTLGRGAWTLENPADISLPVITLSSSELDFGPVCGPSMETLHVCNTGMADLQVESITASDPQFSVTEPTSGYPVVISPDFCFPFEVNFEPTALGLQTATLEITSNDPAEPTLTVDVLGTLEAPDINVAFADSGDFGAVCQGDHSDKDLSLLNQGKCDLTISNIELLPNAGSFDLPDNLGLPLVLSPDASFLLPVSFAPDMCFDNPENRQIKITSDDPDEMMVNIGINGVSPCPNLVIDPTDLVGLYAFPATVVDTGEGALGCFSEKGAVLRNNSQCPLTITDISATGADFAVTAPTVFPVVLPGGEETLEVIVRFTPQSDANPLAPGEVTGLLTVTSNDPDPHTADLCGESVAQSGVRMLVTDVSSGSPVIVDPVERITLQSKGKGRPGPINLQFTDQPASSASVCGNTIDYHVDQETLPSTATTGSNVKSSYEAKAKEGNLQTTETFALGQCEFREFQLQLQDSDAAICLLLPKKAACTTDGECCSGKCNGPAGGKSCK